MSNIKVYIGIPAAVALTYILVIPQEISPYIWTGAIAAICLMWINSKRAPLIGFAIGTMVLLSTYLFYPLGEVSRFSGILSSITSIPSVLLILIYPLIYGIIMGLGALFWSGLNKNLEKVMPEGKKIAGQ